jgi:hypothetical protein
MGVGLTKMKSYQKLLLHAATQVIMEDIAIAEAKRKKEQEDKDNNVIPVQRNWVEDLNKKNYSDALSCTRCNNVFAGNRRRKHCFDCQSLIDTKRKAAVEESHRNPPLAEPSPPPKKEHTHVRPNRRR